MIYFENASRGEEGLNTHVMSYTLCISLSNFLGRDFFFDHEIASSCPPEFPSDPAYDAKFRILLESPRSQVSELVDIPNRRVWEVERNVENKAAFELLHSYFVTTEDIKQKLEGTLIWDSFAAGRHCLTRESLNSADLVEWTHTKLTTPAYFYLLRPAEKKELMASVRIRYVAPIEELARRIADRFRPYYACHFRLSVFLGFFENYSPEIEPFRSYVQACFPDRSRPILLSTEALQKREIAESILRDYKIVFTDELIFDEYFDDYCGLPYTDFNALSVLNQLVCSEADVFIGTYQSSFTAIMHRLRQERYGKRDFNYFPDPKVAQLINSENKIVPDGQGFFDWNRYSVFSSDHAAMGWKREWDHELSMINI